MVVVISHARRHGKAPGFTLVEVIAVVAIITILALIALPAYMEHVRKSRRAEAITLLNRIAQEQERWRANNPSYTTTMVTSAASAASGVVVGSPAAVYYALSIPAAAASSYSISASAIGAQLADAKCRTFTLTMTGGNVSYSSTGSAASSVCWSR